ncbi:hypothetical protein RDABS01_036516, partial [Bienertia sinuspersici]
KTKGKIQWIREGDENTNLFHNSIKRRRVQNNIYAIKDKHGNIQDSLNGIQEAFLGYYMDLLGSKLEERIEAQANIVNSGPVLTELQQNALLQPVSDKEIKQALFAIHGDKAQGPDGFGAHFYKHNWDIVGSDVIKAIRDFFETGKMLKEINSTFISLIPKTACPKDVNEFRPISCCNTICNGITKLLCSRLKEVLPDLISENQGAFVHGRYIVHNIMAC